MKIQFTYTALQVQNLSKSLEFYTTILGMKAGVTKKVKETHGEMCVLRSGSNTLELNHYGESRFKKGTNLDHLAFEVSQLDEVKKMLKTRHIRTYDQLDTANWRRFFIRDPDANWIEIYQKK